MTRRAWNCVSTAISIGMNIFEVAACHFLRQVSSQCGSQKLFQGLLSQGLPAHLSTFAVL